MRALHPRRIVVGARSHAELIAILRNQRPDLEYRGAPHTEVSAADLTWGDSYLGFKRPPVPTWGSVRWVHCTGAGVDAFLLDDPLPDDILLTRTSEPFGPQIAEYCLSRALAFTQRVRTLEQLQAKHLWKQLPIETLAGSRVLVVGTGEVGRAIAEKFSAVGCIVRGVSRSGRSVNAFADVYPVRDLKERVADAHWLVLAAPLTPDTQRLVSREILLACRGAVLINVGRGQVVDERAIPEALDAGALRGAALDVFEVEPLAETSPLWGRADVMISPHVAGLTNIPAAAESFLETLSSIEAGQSPGGMVDRTRGY
jgi:phosphoglycerate dehydrogenase-like enzyme